MTPEEFVMVCEDYEEFLSIYNGMKGDFINVILMLNYLKAKKHFYKLQEEMKNGKTYYFKSYGHTFMVKKFIEVIDPRKTMDINNYNVTTAQLTVPEIVVEVHNKINEPLRKKVPYNGIYEYIDLEKIDPKEYEF